LWYCTRGRATTAWCRRCCRSRRPSRWCVKMEGG
jgi:hypothetical protein